MNRWLSRLKWFTAYLLAVWLFRSTVVDLNSVSGRSMFPTLLPGDIVLVNKLAYGISLPFTNYRLLTWGVPEREDIVIVTKPGKGSWLVKRIAALPGEPIDGGHVQPNHYFVMGDNRAQSNDSRSFGSVPRSALVGRVVAVAVSFDSESYLLPRWGRFLLSRQRLVGALGHDQRGYGGSEGGGHQVERR